MSLPFGTVDTTFERFLQADIPHPLTAKSGIMLE